MQIAVLQDYANGDFGYLISAGEIPDVKDLGDSLLSFILIELSDSEDCENTEQGVSRLNKGKDELDVALLALEKLIKAVEALKTQDA